MKHVTFADKSLLLADESAAALLEYAQLVANAGQSDTVTLPAVGMDGHSVEATFLLTPSTLLVVESTDSTMEPPVDEGALEFPRARIRRLSRRSRGHDASGWRPIPLDDDFA